MSRCQSAQINRLRYEGGVYEGNARAASRRVPRRRPPLRVKKSRRAAACARIANKNRAREMQVWSGRARDLERRKRVPSWAPMDFFPYESLESQDLDLLSASR